MIPEIDLYQKNGLSFFPLPYGKKESDIRWKDYQDRKPTEQEITAWFGNGAKHNIALVCGKISGNLVILDCDSEERYLELLFTIAKHDIGDIQDFTLVTQTGKGYHIFLFVDELPPSTKFPKLDIKSEGGYIVAPPSLHPNGNQYHFLNPGHSIARIKNLLDIGININQKKELPQDNEPDNWVSRSMLGVGQGSRDDTCAKLAGYFLNKHAPDIVRTLLYTFADKCQPPFPHTDVDKVVNSLARRHPLTTPTNNNGEKDKTILYIRPSEEWAGLESDKNTTENTTDKKEKLSEQIENWIKQTNGWFSYEDIDKEFGITTPARKDNRWHIIRRLTEAKVIESNPKNNKLYRFINVSVRLIDFKQAGNKTPISIKYPFGLEKIYNTYPGNIIVIAGAADSGKTAFLLNLVHMNQFDFSIFYQNSEMGEIELASRLEKFEDIKLDEWNFTAEQRSRDFADVIRPDCINIIDYLELGADFFQVGEYLKQIHDKLSTGICIIALQKKRGAELGRGGDFGLEKPRLYLSMDAGKLTIQKAKNWVDPEHNPRGLTVEYKLAAGCKFIVTRDWYKPDEL